VVSPLISERALHYIEQATPEELKIISARCVSLAKELGYEVPLSLEKTQTKGGT